jgi:hypothetical protein
VLALGNDSKDRLEQQPVEDDRQKQDEEDDPDD